MEKFTNPLKNVKIAAPCAADWNEMVGDDRQRYCGACRLNVYNLSGMSQREAENLILQAEGRLCVRFYLRADGTVLTNDCPVGWQAFKRKVSKTATAFASLVFAALGGIGFTNYFSKPDERRKVEITPQNERSQIEKQSVENSIPVLPLNHEQNFKMGEIAVVESKNYPISGDLSNGQEIRAQIKKKRQR